jgi:hypothetical protein
MVNAGPDAARPAGLLSGLTRRSHRPPAIERHLLEQVTMFIAADVRFEAQTQAGQRAESWAACGAAP